MSCRDVTVNRKRIEAIREMNVAQTLMLSDDYIGARDKLLKAKQLCPELDDTGPMLRVCDVLVSAHILKLPGLSMTDHYWVLELTPSSTSSHVHSRYNKLVPILQAIESKFPGTDLALELVHTAYHVLSDREKRSEFDSRREKSWEGYNETQIERGSTSGDSGSNKVVACLDIDQEHDELSDQDGEAIQEFYDFEKNRKGGDLDMVGEDDRFEKYPRKGEIWALHNWDLDCKFTIVEMITDFSQHSGASCVRLVKLDGFRSVFKRLTQQGEGGGGGGGAVSFNIPGRKPNIFSHNIPAHRLIGGNITEVANAVFELDQLALPGNVIRGSKTHYAVEEKQSWCGDDLAAGQVWAVYCGEESRPQQYTRIDRVVSETRVRVTYLEPGPPVTCGVFRLGEISAVLETSQFSHLVEAKSGELCYAIYPRKGEVWAMYESHSDYKTQRCLVTEILSEFSDGDGIKIARLVEVEGCLTFFTRQKRNGFELVRVVPESEMPSFSHRIPGFHCAGIESYGIPEGSWHLEPSALPRIVWKAGGTHRGRVYQ